MSRLDARLSWTLILEPPAPPAGEVAWPRLLQRLAPSLAPPPLDPLQAVVDGAFGHLVLCRLPSGDGGGLIVSGLGAVVGVTMSVVAPGEVEGQDPAAGLRAAALEALGLTAALGGDDAALAAALDSDAGPWSVAGLVEVSAELLEGLPEDLDPDLPAAEVGNVQIVRGSGVGPGHVGWSLTGAFERRSERPVAQRGIVSLSEGHLGRPAPTVAYGAAAVRFGGGLRRAARQIAALDGLLPEVQAACAWATSRAPWPGPGEAPDYARLAARLELLTVGLQESHEALREARVPLQEAAERALVGSAATPGGPFVEASARGEAALDRVAGRVASVRRWAGALALAQEAAAG